MSRRRGSKKRVVDVPVASMGDIAFLLIIFFMVCSNFMKESAVKLDPPTAKDLETIKETQVSVAISKDEEIFLNGQVVPDAEAIEWGVAALIKDKASQEGRTVVFKCHNEIDKAFFEPVLESISKAGALINASGKDEE